MTFYDPIMHELHHRVVMKFGKLAPISPILPDKYFAHLAEAIMGQQLSEKVAPLIVERVKTLVSELTPDLVRATPIERLRAAGLSNAKAQYLHNLAAAWQDGSIAPQTFLKSDNEEIIAQLTTIKGIGRWTVEMFLIFGLGRPDVFSAGDYGLRRAMMLAYKLPPTSKPQEFAELAERWQPQRSLASRVLWKSLELNSK